MRTVVATTTAAVLAALLAGAVDRFLGLDQRLTVRGGGAGSMVRLLILAAVMLPVLAAAMLAARVPDAVAAWGAVRRRLPGGPPVSASPPDSLLPHEHPQVTYPESGRTANVAAISTGKGPDLSDQPPADLPAGPPNDATRQIPRQAADDFQPDVPLSGGEVFQLPGNSTLRVIHTPGHAGNHLCYLLDEERMLFTGDHVMQGSTVVINPPDGDMGAYLRSLRELMALDLDWLAPGHGFLMPQPRRAMEQIVAHRLKREAKVLQAFGSREPVSMDQLLATVYDDVPPKLHAMARRSLTAHLLKLRDDGRLVQPTPDHWALA